MGMPKGKNILIIEDDLAPNSKEFLQSFDLSPRNRPRLTFLVFLARFKNLERGKRFANSSI